MTEELSFRFKASRANTSLSSEAWYAGNSLGLALIELFTSYRTKTEVETHPRRTIASSRSAKSCCANRPSIAFSVVSISIGIQLRICRLYLAGERLTSFNSSQASGPSVGIMKCCIQTRRPLAHL